MATFSQSFFTSRKNNANGQTKIGEVGRLWYEPETNTIRVSDGVTPGGVVVGGSNDDGNGYVGSRGVTGYVGSRGITGYIGSQGSGYVGSQGITGFVGSEGSLGYVGSQGSGYVGSQGSGFVGSEGSLGYVGSQGSGYVGSQGITGFVGSEGSLGYVGSQGSGYTGSASTAIGYSGSAGYTGSVGTGYTGSSYSFNTSTLVAQAVTAISVSNKYVEITTSTSAVVGQKYIVDTSIFNITVTLPSSGVLGDEVMVIDGTGNANTNEITIARNGHKIQGGTSDLTVNTARAAFTLVYYNSTHGWLLTNV